MTDQELAKVLHSLYEAREFRELELATGKQLGDFKPRDNDCHGNADRWVSLHPHHQAVHGFLVATDCLFNKHSVVNTGVELLDITPRPPNESRNLLRFIVLDGGGPAVFDRWPNQVLYTP